jgi:hypothetical protein
LLGEPAPVAGLAVDDVDRDVHDALPRQWQASRFREVHQPAERKVYQPVDREGAFRLYKIRTSGVALDLGSSEGEE